MSDMEFLDVVDDDDKVVGKALRSECHEKGLTHRTVMFFLFDKEGRVFVNKRAQNKEFFGGYHSIVFGGHVNAGQSYEEAVVREAEEETRIKTTPIKLGYFKKRLPEESENVMVYGFISDSEPKLLESEIESGEFMDYEKILEALKERDFLPETHDLLPILKDYLEVRSL
jgi:isopentenyldiphosphate isomerase